MPESDVKPARPLISRVKGIGDLRDAVLVLASLVYLLGYLSWAFYAAQNDLGFIPALDSQYFVAGVLPTAILAAGISLAALQLRFARWSSAEPSPTRSRWGQGLGVAAVGLILGGALVGSFVEGIGERIAAASTMIGPYLLMASALLQGSKGSKFFRVYGLVVLWIAVVLMPLVMLVACFEEVFPHLPAALGGPAPRCVVIDLAVDEVSARTRDSLLPQDPAASSSVSARVRHSRALDLVFDGPEFVMLRVKEGGPGGPVHSVAKHAILAVAPCSTSAPTTEAPQP